MSSRVVAKSVVVGQRIKSMSERSDLIVMPVPPRQLAMSHLHPAGRPACLARSLAGCLSQQPHPLIPPHHPHPGPEYDAVVCIDQSLQTAPRPLLQPPRLHDRLSTSNTQQNSGQRTDHAPDIRSVLRCLLFTVMYTSTEYQLLMNVCIDKLWTR